MQQTQQRQMRRPSAMTLIFVLSGLWLALSPYILGFAWHTTAWWNALVIGIALVILGVIRFASREQFEGLRWTALVLGAWMVASPFVVEYVVVTAAMWNAIIIGAVMIVASLLPMESREARRGEV